MPLGNKIGEGNTAEVYARDEGTVTKLFRSFMPKAYAEHEWSVSRAVAAGGLPVPKVYGMVEVDGRFGVVYERVGAPSMMERLFCDPEQAEEHGRLMAGLHAAMHRQDQVSGLPVQRPALERAIRHAPLLTEEEKTEIAAKLNQLPDGSFVCHGDFHPGNILLSDNGAVVIDWSSGVSGNPLADVMRTRMMLMHAVLPPEIPEPGRLRFEELRKKLNEAYLDSYILLTGVSQGRIEEWELPVAAARLVEGVPDLEKRLLVARIRSILSEEL
ncbi:phosphotransferase family protein [Paenibacillus sp. MBLB4367]|uniref:phosphotransferase family protein n=1 Tax=Paenibacillus sp. MBLB4367 TaxID=3384767 RepID=UPI0039082227